MSKSIENSRNYARSIEMADGIYWVGFYDLRSGLHCNPYLIVDGEEAVVIDGGSRPDFPSVMMKILSTGIAPSSIVGLIYQHFDPDLCASIPHFEDIIGRKDLKVIAARSDHMFIRHYGLSSPLYSLDELDHRFHFSSGRELRFTETPYAHAAGSFVTFDERSGIVFTSDLFGSYGEEWELFLALATECQDCTDFDRCPGGKPYCPLPDILRFHQTIMPSEKALRFALEQIARIPFSIIAPQHGSVIREARDIKIVWQRLSVLEGVGIDRLVGNRTGFNLDVPLLGKR